MYLAAKNNPKGLQPNSTVRQPHEWKHKNTQPECYRSENIAHSAFLCVCSVLISASRTNPLLFDKFLNSIQTGKKFHYDVVEQERPPLEKNDEFSIGVEVET
jgi:hypothetical protein